MERVFDELIGLLQAQQSRDWRAAAITWTLRLTGNLVTGIAIGVGIVVGMMIAA
ncbi:hypothetical protein [Mesorhizobium sp. Cs1321R2N1]|uniref:hypothetical protein n=1 Tax=Mesorhizobium sp. Cs1321R2N1 TaxID=3015174 RepID=UPI00301DC512